MRPCAWTENKHGSQKLVLQGKSEQQLKIRERCKPNPENQKANWVLILKGHSEKRN
jgi:hypothetical protein